MRSQTIRRWAPAPWAFTLLELLVVMALVCVLASLAVPAVARAKAKSRAHVCFTNLRSLGTALAMYDADSEGRIPPAAWRVRFGEELSWDDWLDWYLGGSMSEAERWSAPYSGDKTLTFLECPADRRPSAGTHSTAPRPRSYAMPRYIYDPQSAPWPPRSSSRSGVGIVWDFKDGTNPDATTRATWRAGELYWENGLLHARPPRRQLAVRTSLVRNPSATIALAEQALPSNFRGSADDAAVKSAGAQMLSGWIASSGDGEQRWPHEDLNHYLMMDGHVEALRPQQTVAPGAGLHEQSGLWTIWSRD